MISRPRRLLQLCCLFLRVRARSEPRFVLYFLFGFLLGIIVLVSFDSQRQSSPTCDNVFTLAIDEKPDKQLVRIRNGVPAEYHGTCFPGFGDLKVKTGSGPCKPAKLRRALAWSDILLPKRPMVWESGMRVRALGTERKQAERTGEKSLPRVVLYVLVKSAPRNYLNRQSCRSAWQWRSTENNAFIPGLLSHAFVVGQAVEGKDVDKLNQDVLEEQKKFGDIVVYPGNDTYRRLTWKVLWGLGHALKAYDFDILLFCDDDSFINYAQLFQWIGGRVAKRIYAGQPNWGSRPHRGDKAWGVTREEWPDDYYPPYCLGAGYIMTRDVVNASVAESVKHRTFWIEDVYIGFLVQNTRLVQKPARISSYYAIPVGSCLPSPIFLGSQTIVQLEILSQKLKNHQVLTC